MLPVQLYLFLWGSTFWQRQNLSLNCKSETFRHSSERLQSCNLPPWTRRILPGLIAVYHLSHFPNSPSYLKVLLWIHCAFRERETMWLSVSTLTYPPRELSRRHRTLSIQHNSTETIVWQKAFCSFNSKTIISCQANEILVSGLVAPQGQLRQVWLQLLQTEAMELNHIGGDGFLLKDEYVQYILTWSPEIWIWLRAALRWLSFLCMFDRLRRREFQLCIVGVKGVALGPSTSFIIFHYPLKTSCWAMWYWVGLLQCVCHWTFKANLKWALKAQEVHESWRFNKMSPRNKGFTVSSTKHSISLLLFFATRITRMPKVMFIYSNHIFLLFCFPIPSTTFAEQRTCGAKYINHKVSQCYSTSHLPLTSCFQTATQTAFKHKLFSRSFIFSSAFCSFGYLPAHGLLYFFSQLWE